MQVKIVTYNVLARLLCTDTAYSEGYDPKDLDFETRYERLLCRLRLELNESFKPGKVMHDGVIFCLQEVDCELAGRLQLLFGKWEYDFVFHPYGQFYSDYMGVAMAYPRIFEVSKIDRFRLTSGKSWPKLSYEETWGAETLRWITGGWIDYTSKKYYPVWEKSKRKFNFMLTLKLDLADGRSLYIANVHLPCSFKTESTMITHMALAMHHLQELAGDQQYILAGDFNSIVDSEYYKLLETGKCNENSLEMDFPVEDEWRPSKLEPALKPLRNAHQFFHGDYLEYTTRCHNSIFGATEPFVGTIDHIMISDELLVVDAFNDVIEEGELCPNRRQPSDHLMIGVTVKV